MESAYLFFLWTNMFRTKEREKYREEEWDGEVLNTDKIFWKLKNGWVIK